MLLQQVLGIYDLLDDPGITGQKVAQYFKDLNPDTEISVKTIEGEEGSTDFLKLIFPGQESEGSARPPSTLGIVGRLGGVGARPEQLGTVSDADGAIVALACAAKLATMAQRGDLLPGKVIVTTHICPDAPTAPHDPVPFMGSPVDIKTMNEQEIDPEMDGVLSVDATKGNKVINENGFAISPTVKDGYILQVSEDLLEVMNLISGARPVTFPITTPDITPYGNGLHHINSILQPATATDSPVVGVATTSGATVPGSYTGVNYPTELEKAARFCCEIAKRFGSRKCKLYDRDQFEKIRSLYGSMKKLQTPGE
ncbi:MAG: DUF1177 domain-containing protein [Candidatus Acetothermia bacterium]